MPSTDLIMKWMGLSATDIDKPENADARTFLLWYYERYLPVVAGKPYWSDDIKYYKLPTDTQDIGGKQKVHVTVTSEAFGLLVWENCFAKWKKIFDLKADDEEAEVPRGNTDNAKDYTGKWSDANCGQQKFGGWHQDAYDYFEKMITFVEDWRKKDEENDKVLQKYWLKAMRTKKGITAAEPGGKRKRKAKKAPAAAPGATKKLKRRDE